MAAAAHDALTDPNSPLVNISCFDLLLIELVPLAERMARAFDASLDGHSTTTGPTPTPTSSSSTATAAAAVKRGTATASASAQTASISSGATVSAGAGAGVVGANGAPTLALAADGLPSTTIFRDSVYVRLERLGFRVGEGLSERFSRDRPRFTDQLDVIKFLCKDVWTVVFKKQIDNLKTNHRGVFVLTDSKFRPFARMSMTTHTEAIVRAQPHLYFPCGIIRGVLSSLGIKATVQAETTELPTASFQIKTIPAKS
ncbi:hypothetical protein LTR99_001392 [Exophiala xenobiotica]|uniref:Trafficking protein particle complex subunit 6B n=1 Tax=Vermiconidia calcicola TaxID=1690605 RepID=A0AAV9QLE7_9PEZI|nr:hypothetical protein LTR96_003277 [Exophiala xenobiotica]KAK5545956.1 hypothetical protein LTR25_000966 [Vermiconidia calcicola]KAK5549787.1 hypothetical protein LTR23_000078 [Chaetothyriales sp. CCFEE 6169]KAK5308417.1 hypothetical protein LTR99_001392 [Exophiala xenobiotica]KAK5342688.1 hypothetical protein LTR98_000314 [Exophiala xenobiotica]